MLEFVIVSSTIPLILAPTGCPSEVLPENSIFPVTDEDGKLLSLAPVLLNLNLVP